MPVPGARIYKKMVAVNGDGPQPTDTPVELNEFYRQLYKSLPIQTPRRKRQPVADIPNNAFTAVLFGGVAFDVGGFVKAEQSDRLVIPKDGDYTVKACWQSGAGVRLGAFLYAWIVRSDAQCLDMKTLVLAGQDNTLPPLVYDGPLKAGDYLRLVLLHAQGKPLPEAYLDFGTWMSCLALAGSEAPVPPGPTPPTPIPVPTTTEEDADEE